MKLMQFSDIIGQIQNRKSVTGHDGKGNSDDRLTQPREEMHIKYNKRIQIYTCKRIGMNHARHVEQELPAALQRDE